MMFSSRLFLIFSCVMLFLAFVNAAPVASPVELVERIAEPQMGGSGKDWKRDAQMGGQGKDWKREAQMGGQGKDWKRDPQGFGGMGKDWKREPNPQGFGGSEKDW